MGKKLRKRYFYFSALYRAGAFSPPETKAQPLWSLAPPHNFFRKTKNHANCSSELAQTLPSLWAESVGGEGAVWSRALVQSLSSLWTESGRGEGCERREEAS